MMVAILKPYIDGMIISQKKNRLIMGNYLDNKMVAELKLIMQDDLNMLYEAYLDDATNRLDELNSSIIAQDCEQSRRISHALKGSSCNVGAVNFSQLCEQLELAARDEKIELWADLNSQLHASFLATKSEIEIKILNT
jgi:histidine phosphotransfer protein HptB